MNRATERANFYHCGRSSGIAPISKFAQNGTQSDKSDDIYCCKFHKLCIPIKPVIYKSPSLLAFISFSSNFSLFTFGTVNRKLLRSIIITTSHPDIFCGFTHRISEKLKTFINRHFWTSNGGIIRKKRHVFAIIMMVIWQKIVF